MNQALDLNDCRDQRLPFGFRDDGCGIEHGNFPGLVAIAPFGVNGLGIGERFAGVARYLSGLNRLPDCLHP